MARKRWLWRGEYKGIIDLMITDVVMPQMGGAKLAGELATERPDMRVLFVSGYAETTFQRHGAIDVTARFLQKPFSLKNPGSQNPRSSRRRQTRPGRRCLCLGPVAPCILLSWPSRIIGAGVVQDACCDSRRDPRSNQVLVLQLHPSYNCFPDTE